MDVGSSEAVGNRVSRIAARALKINRELASDVEFTTFATWDSMAALVLLIELEKEFGCKLEPTTLFTCKTVGELCALVNDQLRS